MPSLGSDRTLSMQCYVMAGRELGQARLAEGLLHSTFKFHLGEVFHQHSMDEDVTAANFLQENAFCGVVEETGIVPGDVVVEVKDEA